MIDRIATHVALVWRVASRYRELVADQPPGQREKARKRTQPINRTKGVDRQILKEHGESITDVKQPQPDTIKPNRRDIQPKDVFTPTPDNVGVQNFAETGKDLSNAIERQIPKDKGFETVKNLSQYLIRTEGGGEGGPEGRKL